MNKASQFKKETAATINKYAQVRPKEIYDEILQRIPDAVDDGLYSKDFEYRKPDFTILPTVIKMLKADGFQVKFEEGQSGGAFQRLIVSWE